MIESSVITVEEFVLARILKFAIAINTDTNKKVMLPNSNISFKPPIRIRKLEISAIVIMALIGIEFFLVANN